MPRVDQMTAIELPEGARGVGYAWLCEAMDLPTIPATPGTVVATGKQRRLGGGWRTIEERHAPDEDPVAQLAWAMRNEPVDLLVLKLACDRIEPRDMAAFVEQGKTGPRTRRLWFFYEWLTGREVPTEDAPTVTYRDALDPARYHVGFPEEGTGFSRRHRIVDNLPGTSDFCPIARRSDWSRLEMADRAQELVRQWLGHLSEASATKAVRLMQYQEVRASLAWAKDSQPIARERLARLIAAYSPSWTPMQEANGGTATLLSREAIEAFHALAVDPSEPGGRPGHPDGDASLASNAQARRPSPTRSEGVVVLGHGSPDPASFGAPAGAIDSLLAGLESYLGRMRHADPVVRAASAGFGLLFTHPFEQGNGRVHRWALSRLLSQGLAPAEGLLPVAQELRRRRQPYLEALGAFDRRLTPFVDWRSEAYPEAGASEILHAEPPAEHFRYFDATPLADYLAWIVEPSLKDALRSILFVHRQAQAVSSLKGRLRIDDEAAASLFQRLLQARGDLDAETDGGLSEEQAAAANAIYREAFDERGRPRGNEDLRLDEGWAYGRAAGPGL